MQPPGRGLLLCCHSNIFPAMAVSLLSHHAPSFGCENGLPGRAAANPQLLTPPPQGRWEWMPRKPRKDPGRATRAQQPVGLLSPCIKETGPETQEEARQTQSCFLRDSRNLDWGPAVDPNQIPPDSVMEKQDKGRGPLFFDSRAAKRTKATQHPGFSWGHQHSERVWLLEPGLAFGTWSDFHPFPASSP